ncbi:hypothetical protein ACFOWM_05570 [Ferruginibacter yonginensis]|uniref:Outer membrane protein beta-barrel domain-containing protein n=1 Tax=Ferruginibacter yonginensis TaxID=1310416 RepID=A0ABV8QTS6_9BACT
MSIRTLISLIWFLLQIVPHAGAQSRVVDSVVTVTKVPLKYITSTKVKITTYTDRVTTKTIKTLTKLAKWEAKIKTLLEKASPATAAQLFADGSISFASMLAAAKAGQVSIAGYQAKYDAYQDQLTTQLNFVAAQQATLDKKFIQPISAAKTAINHLDSVEQVSAVMQQQIKARKQALVQAALQHLGKSKYLSKINKEAYYYAATLKNYKALFQEPGKFEATALAIIDKIPAFKQFFKQHSMLTNLFGNAANNGTGAVTANLAGLQTRAGVNQLIQGRIAAGGPNAAAQVSQNMQAAQAQLQQLKNEIFKNGGNGDVGELPDFKPNEQKSKTLKQRLVFGSNVQFGKPSRAANSQANIALSLGYKLNNNSEIGIGAAYQLGYGSIQRLRLRHEGIGLRSYIDLKLKKGFLISGGYELNYGNQFTSIRNLQQTAGWQQAGLLGIGKKLPIKNKFVKGTQFKLFYDMLHNQHAVPTQPFVFRVGYEF